MRVPCALHNSTLVNDQFWALVPPAFTTVTAPASASVLASVVTANNNKLQVESSVLSRSSARKLDSPWDYMQLLKLVDSDDILVPRISRSLSVTSYPTPSIANIPPVQRAHGDVLEPPLGAPEQATPEKQAAQQEQEEDEDELMMQDVAEYLQASLERSLGTPEKYNPMLCASGTINNLVSFYSDIFCYLIADCREIYQLRKCDDFNSLNFSAKRSQARRASLLLLCLQLKPSRLLLQPLRRRTAVAIPIR